MSMFKVSALAVLIPLALVTPAAAQQGPGTGPGFGAQMLFSEMDLDGDGAVTLQEMQTAREGRFARADADGDGILDRDELVAQAMARAEAGIDRLIARADADGDGALSEAELDAMRDERRMVRMERMFDRVDADGDGQVTQAELDAMMDRIGERRGDRGSWGDRRGHGFWRG